jgi:hypothetical protein
LEGGSPCPVQAQSEDWQLFVDSNPVSSCKGATQSWEVFLERMRIAETSFGAGCNLLPPTSPPEGVACARLDSETGYAKEFWLRQDAPFSYEVSSFGRFNGTIYGPDLAMHATELDFDQAKLGALTQDGTFDLQSPVWLRITSEPCSWPELQE